MSGSTRARRGIVSAALVVVCIGAAGCRGAATRGAPLDGGTTQAGAAAAVRRPIELLSFWRPIGAFDSVGMLIALHRKHHPEDAVADALTPHATQARKTIAARIHAGEPPDVFQANMGHDHMDWVLLNGYDDADSKVAPVADVAGLASWRRAVPTQLLDQVTFAGKLYGVPATVHRLNVLYYNKKVFAAHGLIPPKTLAQLIAAGDRLQAAGIPLLATETQSPWQTHMLAFECMLVAQHGAEFYRQYFRGGAEADDRRIVATLNATLALLRYGNSPAESLSWLEAADRVKRGQVAAMVIGDWASPYFGSDDPHSDVGEIGFPGTADVFVATADVFSVPVESRNPEGAQRLLATIASVEAQRALTKVKGCLSPRADVNAELVSPIQKEKARLLASGQVLLALSGAVPKRFNDDTAWAILEMSRLQDIDPVLHTLRSRYCLLSSRKR